MNTYHVEPRGIGFSTVSEDGRAIRSFPTQPEAEKYTDAMNAFMVENERR